MLVSPKLVTIYQQQLSEAVTEETARQVATQWGIAGGVYSSPSEGMADVIFDVMDGSRSMRFLNFPDQFIYQVGYVSPDYGSALMDNGPLPSFEEQVAIAASFLEPFGILDLPYQTMPLETERGVWWLSSPYWMVFRSSRKLVWTAVISAGLMLK